MGRALHWLSPKKEQNYCVDWHESQAMQSLTDLDAEAIFIKCDVSNADVKHGRKP
jgi:hypothetical protein